MEENKRSWIKWVVTLGIGLLIAFIFIVANNGFSGTLSMQDMMKVMSDGFFVSGVLVCGCGLMLFVSQKGSFDMIAYGVKSAIRIIFKTDEGESYYDYKQRKAEKVTPCAHLVVVGALLLLVSVLFVGLFYQA